MEIWIVIWYLALTFSTGTFLLITCNKSRQPVGSKKKLKPKNDSAARSVKSKVSKDGDGNIYENINNNNDEVEDKKSSKEISSKQQPPLRQQPSSEVLSDHRQNKVESDSQPKQQQQQQQKQQSKRETKKGFFLSDSNPPVSLTTSVTKYENAGLLLNQGQQQPSSSDGSGKVVKQPRPPAPPQQSASELGVDVEGQEKKDKEPPYEMLQKDENGADKAAPNKEKSSKKKKKKSKKKNKKKERDSSDDEDSSSEKKKKKKHKKKKKNKDKDDEDDSGKKKKSKKHKKKKKKENDEEDSSTKQTSDAPPSLDGTTTPDENGGILLGPKPPKDGANYEPGLMTQINDALIEGDNGDADERKIPSQLRKAVPPPRPKAVVPVALQPPPSSSYVKGLPKNNRDTPAAAAGLVTAIPNDERQTAPTRSEVIKTGVAQQLPPPSSGKVLSKRSRTLATGTEAPFVDETQAPSLQLQTGIERLPSSPSKVKAAHRLVKTPKALSPAEKMSQRSKETQTHRTNQENELMSQKMIDNTTQHPTELVTQSMTETCIPAATQLVTGKAKTEMTAKDDRPSSQQSMPESRTQNMNTFDLVEVTALSGTKSCKTQPSWLTPTKFEPVNKPERVSPDPALLKPKVLPRDAKAERITKLGLKHGEEAYPTMNDVVSDWGSEAVKPAGEKNGATNKKAGSAKQDCAEEVTATSKSKTSVAARSIDKKPPPSAVTPDELRELRRKEEEERVRKLRENHPKPKPIKRNTYEEKIAKGLETRRRHEYPTFGDVVSDWESVDEKQPSESEESKKDKHKK